MARGKFKGLHSDDRKVGAILRGQRLAQGMTQKQVAARAKITFQQYHRFESNARDIRKASFELACRVLEALNMDIVAFYHGSDFDEGKRG